MSACVCVSVCVFTSSYIYIYIMEGVFVFSFELFLVFAIHGVANVYIGQNNTNINVLKIFQSLTSRSRSFEGIFLPDKLHQGRRPVLLDNFFKRLIGMYQGTNSCMSFRICSFIRCNDFVSKIFPFNHQLFHSQ